MDIIFHGQNSTDVAIAKISDCLLNLSTRYNIKQLREMNLSLTLVDAEGFDVELVDQATNSIYKVLEVYEERNATLQRRKAISKLRLVK